MEIEGIHIERLNHASFKIKKDKVIYVDPFKINDNEKADIILITHEHFDHFSIEDIKKVLDNKTVLVATSDCLSSLNKFDNQMKIVGPGSRLEVNGLSIEATPAYNINKFRAPRIPFHPKEDGKVGYIIEMNRKRIYISGDTDIIPEMQNIKNIDIMTIPVSGTYVMTAEEAAKAVEIIKPKIAIPCHYGSVVGSIEDAKKFKELAKTRVEII
ncbi:MBL fold metallo-hydrolase [Candidatus Woesearchaeota archaeon]|nr:MBL fold metallo-hydrolase [Candidatus Woesearchaeota archaeon]